MKKIIIVVLLSCFTLSVFATPELEATYQGIKAYQAGNYAKALKLLTKASDAGNPNASDVLAQMYYNGQGVSRDYTRALTLFNIGAKVGFPEAIYAVGQIYYFGFGVPADKTKAIELYKKAANGGFGEAQFKLGASYQVGNAVTANLPLAYMWLTVASKNNNLDAKKSRLMTDVTSLLKQAPYCISLGQDNVAQAYYQGIGGLTKSTSEAVSWLEKAHATDPSLGVVNLDLAKMQHNNGDDSAAFKAASEAVSQPYAPAFQYLGTMYKNGIGTDKDLVKAYAYLTVAVELYKKPDDTFYKKYAAPCMPNYKQTTGEFNLEVAENQLSGIDLSASQQKQAEKLVGQIKGWK